MEQQTHERDRYFVNRKGVLYEFNFYKYLLINTPNSAENYWIGGFRIDTDDQGKGLGRKALYTILEFIQENHHECRIISLTV